jgi:ligand-binding sensor domain-containing protein
MIKGDVFMLTSFKIKIAIISSLFITAKYIHAGEYMRLGELVRYDTSNSQIPKGSIYTIQSDDSGKIWTGSWGGGLGVFNGVAWKVFTTKNSGLPSDTILELALDHKNAVWIGTKNGLAKYNEATWTVYTPNNSPMEVFSIWAIAIDHQNNVWFSNGNVGQGGLMFFNGNEWKLFTTENSVLPCRAITDILIDSGNAVWVGTTQFQGHGGLVRIDEDSWKSYDAGNSIIPHNSIQTLSLDKEGKIWAGNDGAYYSSDTLEGALMTITHDGKTWTVNNPSQTGKATRRITAIACDNRGYMWVSTACEFKIDYAVSIFNKKQWITFALSKDDTSRPYYVPDITVDKDNNVWFAIGEGIVMLKQDTLAIDALFAQSNTKRDFKLIPQQKKEMLYHDLLGRKRSETGENVKTTNGVLIGSDNLHSKKVITVK